jgi:glycosyltransferase involved in cell wall biosynthesis
MLISGFTFLRNCSILGYPFVESIRSLLPLVDEYIINIGDSEDDTYERVAAIGDPKIRIIRSQWNERMQTRGFVYAQQKMIAQYNCVGDWAFYLEADEVLHPNDLDRIRSSMKKELPNPRVEALSFHYHHFYGRPDQVVVSGAICRNEVRVIRNTLRTYSPDGLYWMVLSSNRHGRYPFAAHTGAHIYHYGWVRNADKMLEKMRRIERYWSKEPPSAFSYGDFDPRALGPFEGEHPPVMQDWLANEAEWYFRPNPDYVASRRDRKHRVLTRLRSKFGWDFSKRHYIPVD